MYRDKYQVPGVYVLRGRHLQIHNLHTTEQYKHTGDKTTHPLRRTSSYLLLMTGRAYTFNPERRVYLKKEKSLQTYYPDEATIFVWCAPLDVNKLGFRKSLPRGVLSCALHCCTSGSGPEATK